MALSDPMYDAVFGIQHLLMRARGYTSTFVPTSQGPVHAYRARGDRRTLPIVCLHGLGSRAADLAPLLHRLRSYATEVIAVDLPGHGRTPLPREGADRAGYQAMVSEALQALAPTPTILFGNSFGGFCATRFGARHPENVAGLFLVSPGGAPMNSRELDAFLATFPDHRRRTANDFFDRLMPRGHLLRGFLVGGISHRFSRPAIRRILASSDPASLLRAEELSGLPMPVHLLWGGQDRILPQNQREFFIQHLPQGTDVDTPADLGHSPYLEVPNYVAERVIGFLHRTQLWLEDRVASASRSPAPAVGSAKPVAPAEVKKTSPRTSSKKTSKKAAKKTSKKPAKKTSKKAAKKTSKKAAKKIS